MNSFKAHRPYQQLYQMDLEIVDDDSDFVYNDVCNIDDQTLNLLDTI